MFKRKFEKHVVTSLNAIKNNTPLLLIIFLKVHIYICAVNQFAYYERYSKSNLFGIFLTYSFSYFFNLMMYMHHIYNVLIRNIVLFVSIF